MSSTSGLQDAMGREDLDYDVKLRRLSNWLKVPIYIYMSQKKVDDGHAQFNASQRFLWTKFEPDLSMTIVSSDCRFYITLFYNHLNGTFDRIIPLRGCNCQNPAPLSLLRNSQSKCNFLFFKNSFFISNLEHLAYLILDF